MNDLLETLRQDGLARIPGPLAGIRQLRGHLAGLAMSNAHVPFKGTEIRANLAAARAADWPMFCNQFDDVVTAPYMLDLALNYLDLARDYLGPFPDGAGPLVYSLNAFWTQPSQRPRYEQTHKWHRDGDDTRFLVLYMYGTDVPTPEDGAHVFVKTSHRLGDEALPKDRTPLLDVVLGPAGTMFLADSRGLHMGIRPKTGLRSLLWVRWGISDPPRSYIWDKMSPVPASIADDHMRLDRLTPAQRQALRLVFR